MTNPPRSSCWAITAPQLEQWAAPGSAGSAHQGQTESGSLVDGPGPTVGRAGWFHQSLMAPPHSVAPRLAAERLVARMVPPRGFEPLISALKGPCPRPLDD